MTTNTNFKVHRDLLRMDNVNTTRSRIGQLKAQSLVANRVIQLADQVYTFLASELPETYFTSASSAVNRNLTLPSAANIIGSLPNPQVGDVLSFTVDNTHTGGAGGTKTIVLGAGTTSQGDLSIDQNEVAVFDIILQNVTSGSEAIKVIHNSSGSSGGSTIVLADGTAAAPSLSFVNDANTGLFHSAIDDNTFRITTNGVDTLDVSPTGALLNVGAYTVSTAAGLDSQVQILSATNAADRELLIGTSVGNSWSIGQPAGGNTLVIQGTGTADNQNITLDAGTAAINLVATAGVVATAGDIIVNRTAAEAEIQILNSDNGSARILTLGTPTGQWQIFEPSGFDTLLIQGTGTAANQDIDISAGTATIDLNSNVQIFGPANGQAAHLNARQTNIPTVAPGGGAINAAAMVANSTDMAGAFTIGSVSGTDTATLTFNQPYSVAPIVVVSPAAGTVSWSTTGPATPLRVSATTVNGFTIQLTTPDLAGTFTINYMVIGQEN